MEPKLQAEAIEAKLQAIAGQQRGLNPLRKRAPFG